MHLQIIVIHEGKRSVAIKETRLEILWNWGQRRHLCRVDIIWDLRTNEPEGQKLTVFVGRRTACVEAWRRDFLTLQGTKWRLVKLYIVDKEKTCGAEAEGAGDMGPPERFAVCSKCSGKVFEGVRYYMRKIQAFWLWTNHILFKMLHFT